MTYPVDMPVIRHPCRESRHTLSTYLSSYPVVIPCRHTLPSYPCQVHGVSLLQLSLFTKGRGRPDASTSWCKDMQKNLGSPRYGSRHSYVIVPSYLCHDLVVQCSFGLTDVGRLVQVSGSHVCFRAVVIPVVIPVSRPVVIPCRHTFVL